MTAVSAGTTCTYNGAWSPQAPVEDDAVVVTAGELIWGSSLPQKVASWTQTGGTNTFDTGLETFEITGDVSFSGGMWTHTANPTCAKTSEAWQSTRGTKQLVVSCGGKFNFGADARIDVTGCGYRTHEGPGSNVETGNRGGAGGSYGGAGVTQSGWAHDRTIGLCYGCRRRRIRSAPAATARPAAARCRSPLRRS